MKRKLFVTLLLCSSLTACSHPVSNSIPENITADSASTTLETTVSESILPQTIAETETKIPEIEANTETELSQSTAEPETLAPELYPKTFRRDPTTPITLDAKYDEVLAFANQLEDTYDVDIRIAEESSVIPIDYYQYNLCTDIPTIQNCLEMISQCLAAFPDGFFSQLRTEQFPNRLCISLCGTLYGQDDSVFKDASCVTYIDKMRDHLCHYIVMDCNRLLPEKFFHEICHVIDNHIYFLFSDDGTENSFSEGHWYGLNPEGFTYSMAYNEYKQLDPIYTPEQEIDAPLSDSIYFVSNYAKTFPMEDRACLFAKACYFGQEYDGASAPGIQNKLAYMCNYIRYHFDTTGWPEITVWEQGLIR